MISYEVVDLSMESFKNFRRSGNESGLVPVTSCEVLRRNDADRIATFRFNQQNFAVVIGKIGSLDNLGYERPKFESLVCCFVVEYKVYA